MLVQEKGYGGAVPLLHFLRRLLRPYFSVIIELKDRMDVDLWQQLETPFSSKKNGLSESTGIF